MLASTHHSCHMKSVSRHSEMSHWEANLSWPRTTALSQISPPHLVLSCFYFISFHSTAHYLVEHLFYCLFYVYVYCLSLDCKVHKYMGFVLFPTLTPAPRTVSVILAAAQ